VNRTRGADLSGYLTRVVSGRLGRHVSAGDPLLDQPGFDSLAIVAVIDEIERDLDVEFAPELLVPETFATLDTLTAAVERCPTAGASATSTREGGWE
jgi:acyl carrier protein